MAIAVNTWAEFLAAYENGTDGTIELMADIDANDDLPKRNYSKPRAKTINGNGHAIYNISTAQVVSNPIFSGGYNLVFNNTNFYNCYRIENQPIFWSSNSYRTQFNDCKIVGRGLQYISVNATFNRCSFVWSGVTSVGAGDALSFYNSLVKIDHRRASNSANRYFGTLNNSYIEGKFEQTADGTFNINLTANTLESSVINIETSATSSTFLSGTKSVYNKTKAPNFTDSGNCEGVTDAQLKNAEYLASIGFNIVT